jgi:hypothetical protein
MLYRSLVSEFFLLGEPLYSENYVSASLLWELMMTFVLASQVPIETSSHANGTVVYIAWSSAIVWGCIMICSLILTVSMSALSINKSTVFRIEELRWYWLFKIVILPCIEIRKSSFKLQFKIQEHSGTDSMLAHLFAFTFCIFLIYFDAIFRESTFSSERLPK